jgi:hypothetical protein
MAFVRCLTPEIVAALAANESFAPKSWTVWRVADAEDTERRTITADHAVELRESKAGAIFLLVDTARAGAGMDGIYSAAQEIGESSLFREALRLALGEVTQSLSRAARQYAETAATRARALHHRLSLSPWTEFDFFARIAAERRHPGELLHLLGLWPVKGEPDADPREELDMSRIFVDRLVGASVAGLSIGQRIESVRLLDPSDEQLDDLERFLRSAATKPVLSALSELADKRDLWVNELMLEGATETIRSIELVPWRTNTGKIASWSGLREAASDHDDDHRPPPEFIIDPEADSRGDYSKLEVRWKARPDNLGKGAVDYRISIVTDMDEEIASHQVTHTGKRDEKCRFTNDDFSLGTDDVLISAKVSLSVLGNDTIEKLESEEFTIRFGTPPEREPAGLGRIVRTFSEGLIELNDREAAAEAASSSVREDSRGFMLFRTSQRGRNFRVWRPPLLREVEQQWAERSGAIGRWRVRVRGSGARAGDPEFISLDAFRSRSSGRALWDRVGNASRRMAERFAAASGVGQVYDEKSRGFDTIVKEYLLAWAALLEESDPTVALANTVEVQSLSDRTIGLIVLPGHPLRAAWHVAYDNLVFHTRFECNAMPKQVREEFSAMFPAFLPAIGDSGPFVFADTLGFHAVGMVPDRDKEPKAAIALLARALGESETASMVPTVGAHSAEVLGKEICKYISTVIIPRGSFISMRSDRETVSPSRDHWEEFRSWCSSHPARRSSVTAITAPRRPLCWNCTPRPSSGASRGGSSPKRAKSGAAGQACWLLRTAGCSNRWVFRAE